MSDGVGLLDRILRRHRHAWRETTGIAPFEPKGEGPHFVGERDCPVGPHMDGCQWLKEYPNHRHVTGYVCDGCGAAVRHRPAR